LLATVKVPDPPAAPKWAAEGLTEYVQELELMMMGYVITTTPLSCKNKLPRRGVISVFGATLTVEFRFRENPCVNPDAGENVTPKTSVVRDQGQPSLMRLKLRNPVPPEGPKRKLCGSDLKLPLGAQLVFAVAPLKLWEAV
jgi:hypothetical protein